MTEETERPRFRRALHAVAVVMTSALDWGVALLLLIVGFPLALLSRLAPRRIDVGLGPEPLINNVYHKRALATAGYSAETFVDQVYFITSEFDYLANRVIPRPLYFLRGYWLFVRALFRYKALYVYFNGGPLMFKPLLWRIEPLLYRAAGVRTVVMPYGGDVQELTRTPNLLYKHAMSCDYPWFRHRRARIGRLIDVWTRGAGHVLSGVEWVDYMYHWDTLMLGHFSIDTEQWRSDPRGDPTGPLRVLHAPNHRRIKGTSYFISAIEELRAEGVDIELRLLERVPNEEVHRAIREADVIADQLVVGWYAMFALEGMASEKAVVCYLRDDLVKLYTEVGLIEPGEIPIVNADPLSVKDVLRHLAEHRDQLREIGERGRRYVLAHHSLEYIGGVFASINASLGIPPSDTDKDQRCAA